jgi:hypothetical protein
MSIEETAEKIEEQMMEVEKGIKREGSFQKLHTALLGIITGLVMMALSRLFSINEQLIRQDERLKTMEAVQIREAAATDDIEKRINEIKEVNTLQGSRLTIIESKLK